MIRPRAGCAPGGLPAPRTPREYFPNLDGLGRDRSGIFH